MLNLRSAMVIACQRRHLEALHLNTVEAVQQPTAARVFLNSPHTLEVNGKAADRWYGVPSSGREEVEMRIPAGSLDRAMHFPANSRSACRANSAPVRVLAHLSYAMDRRIASGRRCVGGTLSALSRDGGGSIRPCKRVADANAS